MVFISAAYLNSNARKSVTNPFQFPDYQAVIPQDQKNILGEPMGPDEFPSEAWISPDAGEIKTLPNLFYGGGFWFVSAKASVVLKEFDLGLGALYPVNLYAKDRATQIGDGGWHCINFGNVKTAFLPEASETLRPPSGNQWMPHASMKDDAFAVSQTALVGPDIWIDSRVAYGIFLSNALGKALTKAKAASGFDLRRCRVVG